MVTVIKVVTNLTKALNMAGTTDSNDSNDNIEFVISNSRLTHSVGIGVVTVGNEVKP